MRSLYITAILFALGNTVLYAAYPKEQRHYWSTVMPIMRTHCNNSCHNADDNKGGLNLNRYDFILTIQRDGEVFAKVIDQIETGVMPPEGKPPLSQEEKDTLLFYLNKYLGDALNKPDPGLIPPRRMSNREYGYVIQDLTGIRVNTDSIFPKDPAGGEGFDNFARSLYITPLLMERYFDVATLVVEQWQADQALWRSANPTFRLSLAERFRIWWQRWFCSNDISGTVLRSHARERIIPFATRAYRRYLSQEEEDELLDFFETVYFAPNEDIVDPFEESLAQVYKRILVSHNFLLRHEADPDRDHPYPISDFELATRLSFFLWSSIPDYELLEAAYRQDLHQPEVLRAQVSRMFQDPRIKRMAESFATQWLGIELLKDPTNEKDAELFPEFSEELRLAMRQEAIEYFHYAFTESRNLLELLDGQYTFLNETLAEHYGIEGIEGSDLQRVVLNEPDRGGILGMGGIHAVTSLPNRTSPVLRGKWVMEKILATKAKPPPPNVPELEASKNIHDELTLRELLVQHREDQACIGCHQEMDDLGFALENYDAIGRWRTHYKPDGPVIDVSGSLKSGEYFVGPQELKEILIGKKEQFAKSISRRMLGFALGRSIEFKDTKTIDHLSQTLLDNDFDPVPFLQELAYSYPFRYKKSDPVVVDTDFGD